MANKHEEILAKGESNGSVSLYQHLKDVADIAVVVAAHEGMDERTALVGALLHDIGKTSNVFQKTLKPNYHPAPHFVFRHEIASLLFLSLIDDSRRDEVIEMIAAHHKSVYRDVRELGLLDLDESMDDAFATHAKDFDHWQPTAVEILASLGLDVHPISLEEARDNYDYAVDYCSALPQGCCLNRTFVELKHHVVPLYMVEAERLNRTFVELKLYDASGNKVRAEGLNRTFVELKRGSGLQLTEPLAGLNRTFVELKHDNGSKSLHCVES